MVSFEATPVDANLGSNPFFSGHFSRDVPVGWHLAADCQYPWSKTRRLHDLLPTPTISRNQNSLLCGLAQPLKQSATVIFTGTEIVTELTQLGISHVIWIPDSDIGRWESDLASSPLELLRVCREGEAWPLAAGLILGGMRPLVMLQTTGLFESGDALRNVVYDLRIPVFALVGARSWLAKHSQDSAKTFAEPILSAWNIDYVIIESQLERHKLGEHYLRCQAARKSGAVLLAE